MLFEIVLSFEGLSADLTGEGHVVLVTALMYHEVIGLGKTPLAVLADELDCALGAHLLPAAELPAVPLCLHRHYREHPYKFPPLPRSRDLNRLDYTASLSLSLSLFSLSISPFPSIAKWVPIPPPSASDAISLSLTDFFSSFLLFVHL